MSRPRYTIAFVMLIVITTNQCCCVVATSSSSSSSSSLSVTGQSLPSTESNITDSNANSVQPPSPSNSHPQVVTFLYELYEHEIYNPNTGSWGSRRFTQSRESGGGGRDYQSLDPQTCSPPRGTVFEGEWKIDVKGTGETRDGFGWEYYVGKYDGLGRRRRRWLRNLRRVGGARGRSSSSAYYNQMLRRSRTDPTKATTTTATSTSSPKSNTTTKQKHPLSKSNKSTGILKGFQQQYHFQGFGWSFFKSLLSKRSMGASLRIPISANFDFYDKKLAWPVITTTAYFGYPWVVATFLNASLPVEAVKWFIGGIIWKITWAAAILSACLRGIAEGILSILMLPWTIFQAFVQVTNYVKARLYKIFVYETEDQKIAQSLMESVGGEDESDVDATTMEKNETNIDSYVELSTTSSGSNAKNDTDDCELVSVPQGGASGRTTAKHNSAKRKRKKYVTLFGHEIPTFHRANTIEYSTTISERVGICVSWRVSHEHGYEYRWNFFYSCLPTLDFWSQVNEARRQQMGNMYRKVGFWGVKKQKKEVGTSPSSSSSSSNFTCTEMEQSEKAKSGSPQSSSNLYSFLVKHSASLGYSAGWPLPVDPYFSFSILLSLSGFYYAWLLKCVRFVFLLGAKSSKLKVDENSSESELLTEATPASSARTAQKSSAVKRSSKSDLSKEADIANDETESECDETVDETESEDEEGLSVSKMESEESSNDTTNVLIKRKA